MPGLQNDEQKDDALTQAIKRNKCLHCSRMKLAVCKCGGVSAGGSADGGGSAGSDSANNQVDEESRKVVSGFEPVEALQNKIEDSFLKPAYKMIDIEQLLQLLAIENDPYHKTLTIRFKPGLTQKQEEDLERFLKAEIKGILYELGIPVHSNTLSFKDNALTISIFNAADYTRFIQKLISMGALPQSNMMQQIDAMKPYQPMLNPTTAPTPRPEPKPKGYVS